MASKAALSNTKKASKFSNPIRKLEACIDADGVKLEKAYHKVIPAAEKEVIRLSKAFNKTKASKLPKKDHLSKKILPNTKESTQLAVLKEEVAALKVGFKKLQAKKKLLQSFEKLWVQKLNKMHKPKKLNKKPRKQSEVTSVASGFS